MTVRRVKSTVTLAAAVAAAFAAFTGAGTAEAACASFWGIGNGNGCTSSPGNFAIVTHDGAATATGIGGAISVGEKAFAKSDGLFTAALASGKNTYAQAYGVGSLAQDIANDQNGKSTAVAGGWFNRALNYGNSNVAAATSGLTPALDLETGNIDIGNSTVLNIGNGNIGLVGTALPGAPGGFSNGVYQCSRIWSRSATTTTAPPRRVQSTRAPSRFRYPTRPSACSRRTTCSATGTRPTRRATSTARSRSAMTT
jgi:hypothetical protein